jgi:hypothetical protein
LRGSFNSPWYKDCFYKMNLKYYDKRIMDQHAG